MSYLLFRYSRLLTLDVTLYGVRQQLEAHCAPPTHNALGVYLT